MVEWSRLSPRGFEFLRVIALRASAGYESREIAEMIEADRASVQEVLPLPPKPLNAAWVNNQCERASSSAEDLRQVVPDDPLHTARVEEGGLELMVVASNLVLALARNR